MTPLLSDLREPPVVGKFYMVPVIRNYWYCGKMGDWPVIGPMHVDADFFNFTTAHYHVDARFISPSMEDRLINGTFYASSLQGVVGGVPLSDRSNPVPKGRPMLARRKCYRSTYGNSYQERPEIKALNAHYGAPAQPIDLADGRRLCPHRKVDLSQFPADENGIVVCPLHGLRVDMRRGCAPDFLNHKEPAHV